MRGGLLVEKVARRRKPVAGSGEGKKFRPRGLTPEVGVGHRAAGISADRPVLARAGDDAGDVGAVAVSVAESQRVVAEHAPDEINVVGIYSGVHHGDEHVRAS